VLGVLSREFLTRLVQEGRLACGWAALFGSLLPFPLHSWPAATHHLGAKRPGKAARVLPSNVDSAPLTIAETDLDAHGYYRVVTVSSDSKTRQVVLEEVWRRRLEQAQHNHEQEHTAETHIELHRVLRIFTDFVMYGKSPEGWRDKHTDAMH